MADINLEAIVTAEHQSFVVLRIPKAVVVLTREQFIQAFKRGKRFRRQQALQQRVAEETHSWVNT
jgi:hypothetical protein